MRYQGTHENHRLQSTNKPNGISRRHITMVLFALSFVVTTACLNTSGTEKHESAPITPPPSTPVGPAPTSAPQPGPEAPVTCQTDGDCPHLSCGPCRSGQVITQLFIMVNCAQHPCPGVTAVCRDGQCVVQ